MTDQIAFFIDLLCFLGALLLVGLFEAVLLTLSQARSRKFRELGADAPESWKLGRLLRTKSSFFLLTAQVGFFISTLVLGGVILWALHEHFPREILPTMPAARSAIIVVGVLLIGAALWVPIHLVRLLASTYPEYCLIRLVRFAYLSGIILGPVARTLQGLSSLMERVLSIDVPTERELAAPGEDIREIVELTGPDETLEEEEKEMIRGVFKLDETMVREIMTPRADVISAEEGATFTEILGIYEREKLSRILITGDTLDDVRGVIHSKDLLPFAQRQREFSVSRVMRPACVVPGTRMLGEVLQEFQREGIHFAVVLDEHGGVDGVVTVEDLLEEIVGEIFDEFDTPSDSTPVRRTKSGDLVVAASITIQDANEELNFGFPEGEYDTLAGFVLHSIGRIPQQGEVIELAGNRVRIEKIDANRLVSLRFINARQGARPPRSESIPVPLESTSSEVPKQSKVEGY